MNRVSSVEQERAGHCVRLSAIDWRTYSRLLRTFAEQPGVRMAYDHGDLEIMSPLLEHDYDGRFLGDLVVALTDELGLPLKRGGSTTLRRRLRQRGIEPDESFWIANAPRMAGRRDSICVPTPRPILPLKWMSATALWIASAFTPPFPFQRFGAWTPIRLFFTSLARATPTMSPAPVDPSRWLHRPT